jgi:penicillin-binding protein 1C
VIEESAARPLVSPRAAFWITDILSDGEAREYIFGRGGHLEFPFPVAAKTGTSQAYHDNWTVGYTRDVTVGVWVGNFDRTPLRDSTGVTGAGPIFHAVMHAAAAAHTPAGPANTAQILSVPDGLVPQPVCALSGMRASAACPSRRKEWLPAGDVEACSWHRAFGERVAVEWPPQYRGWAAQQGLLMADLPEVARTAARRGGTGPADAAALAIANPPSGATYSIDPTLRPEFQAIALRALASAQTRVEWHVDDRPVGHSVSGRPLLWPLVPGTHRITARDERGRTAEATIVVR